MNRFALLNFKIPRPHPLRLRASVPCLCPFDRPSVCVVDILRYFRPVPQTPCRGFSGPPTAPHSTFWIRPCIAQPLCDS